jgi:energy-coupling factor transporter transmembrane protein EcfT
MLSAPSVVIRLALQISSATLTAALLLWTGPSADITELAARVKSKASSGFSK